MRTKAVFSVVLLFVYLFIVKMYHSFQGILESQLAVKQLEDSSFSYGMSNFVIDSNLYSLAHIIFWSVIGMIWIPTIINIIKTQISKERA